jgi:hypothetical protein
MTTGSKKASAAPKKKAKKSASTKAKAPAPKKKPAAKKAASSSKKAAPAKKPGVKKPAAKKPAAKKPAAKKPAVKKPAVKKPAAEPAKKPAAAPAKEPAKEPAKSSGGGLSVLDLYDVPSIEQDNWGLWLEQLEDGPKSVLDKLRSQVASKLEALGARTLFVPLPANDKGYFLIDYVWDYAREKFDDVGDDNTSTIIFAVKLDFDLHFYFESGGAIAAQHAISKRHRKSVLAALQSELGDRLEWDGKSASVIRVRLQ